MEAKGANLRPIRNGAKRALFPCSGALGDCEDRHMADMTETADDPAWSPARRLHDAMRSALAFDDDSRLTVLTHRAATLVAHGAIAQDDRRLLVEDLGYAGLHLVHTDDPTVAYVALRVALDQITQHGWGHNGTAALEPLAERCREALAGSDWHAHAASQAMHGEPRGRRPVAVWALWAGATLILIATVVIAMRALFGAT